MWVSRSQVPQVTWVFSFTFYTIQICLCSEVIVYQRHKPWHMRIVFLQGDPRNPMNESCQINLLTTLTVGLKQNWTPPSGKSCLLWHETFLIQGINIHDDKWFYYRTWTFNLLLTWKELYALGVCMYVCNSVCMGWVES